MAETVQTQNDLWVHGDALFTGTSSVALWNLLVALGLLSKEQALNSLASTLQTMEECRKTWHGDAATIEQAGARIGTLMHQINQVTEMAAILR